MTAGLNQRNVYVKSCSGERVTSRLFDTEYGSSAEPCVYDFIYIQFLPGLKNARI